MLLPFILVIMVAFWVLGSLGNLLIRGVTMLASNAVAAKAGQRGL
jgi:hypothetical protein